MARASGDYAIVVAHNPDAGITRIKLPSGTKKVRFIFTIAAEDASDITANKGRGLDPQSNLQHHNRAPTSSSFYGSTITQQHSSSSIKHQSWNPIHQ